MPTFPTWDNMACASPFFADILDHSGREVDEQRTLPAQCPDGDHMPIVFHAMDEGLGRSLLRMLL